MKIPFINLPTQYESIQQEIDAAIKNVLEGATFIGGYPVREFENRFAEIHGAHHCIGTGNGTDSLFLILKALNISSHDEVIVPAFGCMPTAEVVTLAGAKVIFTDVHPLYYTIDPESIRKKITSKTKAIIVVHLYGQAAQMDELRLICTNHNIHLIEDCAQSHLTIFNNQYAGTFGVASAFSFYPTKNLGAYGDAGCVLTNDASLAEKIRRLANHGALNKDDHVLEGTNSRLDTLQAAVLGVKLNHLHSWTEKRMAIATRYIQGLQDIQELTLPAITPNSTHTFHIFCVATPVRDELQKHLAAEGIQTLIHYPKGLPFTPAYAHLGHAESDFPVTARLQNEVLSLPVYPELTTTEVDYIIESIRNFF